MAGFRMHVGTSTVLGCGYAGALAFGYHVPYDTAILSGAMCGFSGMLPDLDSDYGVPLREAMAFTAALAPMLLIGHFQKLGLSHDGMALAAVGLYLGVRFGVTRLIRRFTVHRGMFHSIPAMLIFGGLAFLVAGTSPLEVRCYKAGGVMGGCFSHLLLDEIYSVEWKGGRWRLKKSFGTAIKFWGDDMWSNFSTYAKLAIVVMMILGEPSVMQQLEARTPQFASQLNGLRNQLQSGTNALTQGGSNAAQTVQGLLNNALPNSPQQFVNEPQQYAPNPPQYNPPGQWPQWPANNSPTPPSAPPPNYGNPYDTAQRPTAGPFAQ